jgi:hypothetical protein
MLCDRNAVMRVSTHCKNALIPSRSSDSNTSRENSSSQYGRGIPEDYNNVFRMHRIMNGRVDDLADPFFGPIVPSLEPVHPDDRDSADDGDEG